MKKFKFQPPYKAPGKTTFPGTRNRSGVYLIKEDGKIVYIGYSGSNLYRTMYRHFEAWSHSQKVVTYKGMMKSKNYTIRVVLCTTIQAARLERALIIKYQPRDNDEKYKGYQLKFPDEKIRDEYFNSDTLLTEIPF